MIKQILCFVTCMMVFLAGGGTEAAEKNVSSGKSVEGDSEQGGWMTSVDAAKVEAGKRHVPILVDFSGSDWCGWCIKLDKEVFSKPEFKDYADKGLVLLLVDFPRRKFQSEEQKKQNEVLARSFGVEGFPTVLLIDEKGKELARTGYQPGGAVDYVKHLKGLIDGK